jgi:hypothetical protein
MTPDAMLCYCFRMVRFGLGNGTKVDGRELARERENSRGEGYEHIDAAEREKTTVAIGCSAKFQWRETTQE